LRVKLSANVAQTGPNSFNNNESFEIMEKEDPKEFALTEAQWGDYPVHAIRTRMKGKLIFTAWVGLNDPEAGWTLMFNLVYPDTKGRPNTEDRQLWENFITKTTQLKDGDYFKACGQDLQEGYTLVNVGGVKLKMIAEKRQNDGTIQVVVIPESSDVEFRYLDMEECRIGAKWKYGEPMVKVYGEIVVNNKKFHSIINSVTSIFFKNVPDFTIKNKEVKKHLIFQKIYEKQK
jgi:hypothetical protein